MEQHGIPAATGDWHDDAIGGHTAVWIQSGQGTGTEGPAVLWGPVMCGICGGLRDTVVIGGPLEPDGLPLDEGQYA